MPLAELRRELLPEVARRAEPLPWAVPPVELLLGGESQGRLRAAAARQELVDLPAYRPSPASSAPRAWRAAEESE